MDGVAYTTPTASFIGKGDMEVINLDELGLAIFGPSKPRKEVSDWSVYVDRDYVRMTYLDYLKTPWWKKTAREAIIRAGKKCQLCSSKYRLEVHHNSYDHLGCEPPEDIVVLCHKHHSTFHGKVA